MNKFRDSEVMPNIVKTFVTCLLYFLLASHRAQADDGSSTETNEIIPREAIQKLDISVRQALLRAIDKLEREAADEENQESDEDVIDYDDQENGEYDVAETNENESINVQAKESTNSSDTSSLVQFFTATFDEKNAKQQSFADFINSENFKNVHSPTVKNNTAQVLNNHQIVRSVKNRVKGNEIILHDLDDVKFEVLSSKGATSATTTTTTIAPRGTKKRTTTTTTTTTTTPRPTHNEDGENIEVVAKDDIRIQAAPLVSAFTVDLDEMGAAKKVIPIVNVPAPGTMPSSSTQRNLSPFRNAPLIGSTATKLNVLQEESSALNGKPGPFLPTVSPVQSTFSTTPTIFSNLHSTAGHYITKQPLTSAVNQPLPPNNNVNSYLIERQRELEQQIYQLKLQAQQQQELILRQLKLLEDQHKLRNAAVARPANTIIQQSQHRMPPQLQELTFTIRPSVEFIPASTTAKISSNYPTFPTERRLPLRELNGKFDSNVNANSNSNTFSSNLISSPQHVQNAQHAQQQQQQQFFNNNAKRLSLQKTKTNSPSNVHFQVQESNQFSIASGANFPPLSLAEPPAELSLLQSLPQRSHQQFLNAAIIPQYATNTLLDKQQQRLFRQNTDVGNFGLNQMQIQSSNAIAATQQQLIENQHFYRQYLQPQINSQLQQNARLYRHQREPQPQSGASGNFLFRPNQVNTLPNLEEFNVVNKVLALNHGFNNNNINNNNNNINYVPVSQQSLALRSNAIY
uniref:Uncharacterized protein n=1 Tax=Glossina brevipalpis TaxID=37001 RepID=A0A1A9WYZ4_9MUSC